MQKFTTYIILISLLASGLLLVYKSFLSSGDFTHIKGTVLKKQIELVSVSKGSSRYGIVFKIDNYHNKLGIYIGTEEQAAKNVISNLIEVNNVYTFLIDPTVSISNDINLGIREIWFNGNVLYKESQNFTLFTGIFFYIILLYCTIYNCQKKKK
jgi:hypothetical protein